ncbi:sensor histidine kinase [bacterium SCSIO 12741]|nr:sensor histidine kinase [bacterium SCSIO 12741]
MRRVLLVISLIFPLFAFGQRNLKPSVHLRPFAELEQATVMVLAEDSLGQIWIGTQTGIRYWDGTKLRKPNTENGYVTHLHFRDSCIYALQLNYLYKINVYSMEVESYDFPYPDYRNIQALEHGFLTISRDFKDTLLLDYQLSPIENGQSERINERQDTAVLGAYVITNEYVMGPEDTLATSHALTGRVVQFDENHVFVASHEGLIEYALDHHGNLIKNVHVQSDRVENILVDRYQNLWVGTAENGLLQFHKNMILHNYYKESLPDGSLNPCWTIGSIDGRIHYTTSHGIRELGATNSEATAIEKATAHLTCFSFLETDEFVWIGTAKKGLYKYVNGRVEPIYFNSQEYLDNTIVQILEDGQDYLVCSKYAIHRIDRMGKVKNSYPFKKYHEKDYSMQLVKLDSSYLSANTIGIVEYDQNFVPQSRKYKDARVFSDLTFYQDSWWITSLDGGVYRLEQDSLVEVPTPQNQLLKIRSFQNNLWITGLSGALLYRDSVFTEFGLENGFPITEYAQGGLYNYQDSLILFSGVEGVFEYNGNGQEEEVLMPQWHLLQKDTFLPPQSSTLLNYDVSVVQLLPRAIITTDRNRFDLSYTLNGNRFDFENGVPLLLDLNYGDSKLVFEIKNLLTGAKNSYAYHFYRAEPIWLKTWFQILLGLGGLMVVLGFYVLYGYFKTRKLLKQEEEHRKISQERLRISRELHDNIGARLTHIISSIDVELYRNAGDQNQLEAINSFARETMSQLRETIWAVSDQSIFFSELLLRVDQYVSQANQLTPIQLTYRNASKSDFELNSAQVINFFRIAQEAINNAIKYSEARQIEVSVEEADHQMQIKISDDGMGFDAATQTHGSGLRGMRHRATEVAASLSVTSKKGKGTTIKITIPFHT